MALTLREREVLGHLAAGRDSATAARLLGITPYTVRTHVRNLLRKLGVPSSLAAVALARRAGLEDDRDPWVSAAEPP